MPVMVDVGEYRHSLAGRSAKVRPEQPDTPGGTWPPDRIHPNAPAGGGGPGFFRYSTLIEKDSMPGPSSTQYLHPSAPVSRFLVAAATPIKAPVPAPKPKAPPATVPNGNIAIPVESDDATDITITAKVLADGTDDSLVDRAETRMNLVWNVTTPGYSFAGTVVKKLEAKATLTITLTLQTFYGNGVNPTSQSAYGRGTTKEDKASGDVTLGFHEANHRQDYLNFVKSFRPPRFSGKAGMKVKDLERAIKEFESKCKEVVGGFEKAASQESERKTDEVGYKKSEYQEDHPG